jgi:pimeloyl-ACP methyl ester carboxylesterase
MSNRLAIAVGGLGYSIEKFVPTKFRHFMPIRTGGQNLTSLIANANGPITLLGFSWGAEIVIRASLDFPDKNIEHVIAHSPGKGTLRRSDDFGPSRCKYTFLATTGDRVCYNSTKTLAEYFSEKRTTEFHEFPFNEDHQEDAAWVFQKFMIANKHQFVNSVEYLESINWGL